ncbi:ribonuclease HI [Salinispirillum sp. LH 10-3-1]|uniref:Ribonuclease H n=1 Tax=Salinispirillum sp. LH 10-3-1 TaxID=2952525 RepID=A0AB38YJN3_9GAMM
MVEVVIYTDGACKGNPGPGGWGAFMQYGKHAKELFGGEANTTNNRMELRAAIEGLSALNKQSVVKLYTDSSYVKNGIEKWMTGWKRNGWKTASKQPVKNVDLWQQLDELVKKHEVHWHWVKGHAGNPGNEKADELANLGAQKYL